MGGIGKNGDGKTRLDDWPSRVLPEMAAQRQWVVWKLERRGGETDPTKVPYNPHTGGKAMPNNTDTWGTVEQAIARYCKGGYTGIGFMFSNGFCGVDLDKCRNPVTGEIEQWALDVVHLFDSYTEISPSETGLHIFAKGKLPGSGLNRTVKGHKHEMYDSGRFFTFTGLHVDGTPKTANERQSQVEWLYRWIVDISEAESRLKEPSPRRPIKTPSASIYLSDIELLEKARNASNGGKFERLWAGDATGYQKPNGEPDRSRADSALVMLLCFWSQDDGQVERLWLQSGLYRKKMERDDYRAQTIKKARWRQNAQYAPGTDYYEVSEFEDASDDETAQASIEDEPFPADEKADWEDLDYDPPLAANADLDKRVRLALKDYCRVTDHATWLFSALGVQGDHSRIINSIVAVADANLKWFQTNQMRLHERGYDCLNPKWEEDSPKVKGNRVGRDLRDFIDALESAGLVKKRFSKDRRKRLIGCEGVLDYRSGRTGVNSWMRANFLRYMGQAFARTSSVKKERQLKWLWQARKAATSKIAATIPRFDVEKVTNPKKEAEIREEQASNAQIKTEARGRLAKELRRFWESERNAGFSFEEVDADMREEYLSALSWGLERESGQETAENLHVHQNGVHVTEDFGTENEDFQGCDYSRSTQNQDAEVVTVTSVGLDSDGDMEGFV